jgi:GT2 family glycosyltransferase
MAETGVVILNWNGIHLMEQFLPALIAHTNPLLADIIVVDNGSSDGSASWLRNNFPGIILLQHEQNYGFAEGYNRALHQLNYPFYVLLNSDVEVTPQWLEPLIQVLKNNREIAAVMPRIRAWHNKEYFEHAGAAGGFLDRFGYPFCRGRIFNVVEKDAGQYETSREVFWASGACMLVRGDVYEAAGGLDNFFFAHMEEIDLCWRMHNMGYKVYYCHTSTVFHIGGATLPKKDHRKTFLNFRNNFILLYKNLPPSGLKRILAVRILLDWISVLFFLVKGEFRECYAVVSAHFSLMGHLISLGKKRKETRKMIGQYRTALLFSKSIVYQFYIKGVRYFSQLPLS